MREPWGIEFGRDGRWAMTDYTNHCVWMFDRDDQLVRKFGSYGTANGQFGRPLGVAFDHNNHRVQKSGTQIWYTGIRLWSTTYILH